MDIKTYYMQKLAHLESPEFVTWFESWYGLEFDYVGGPSEILDLYWSERRFALLGWHAALLPNAVSADKVAFVRSLGIKGA